MIQILLESWSWACWSIFFSRGDIGLMKMQVLIAVQANQVASLHQITKLKFKKKSQSLVPTATQEGEPSIAFILYIHPQAEEVRQIMTSSCSNAIQIYFLSFFVFVGKVWICQPQGDPWCCDTGERFSSVGEKPAPRQTGEPRAGAQGEDLSSYSLPVWLSYVAFQCPVWRSDLELWMCRCSEQSAPSSSVSSLLF